MFAKLAAQTLPWKKVTIIPTDDRLVPMDDERSNVRAIAKAIGRAVHRPALAAVPPIALRAALGGFADEGVLVSQRVLPSRLEDAGFVFTYADVDSALAALL